MPNRPRHICPKSSTLPPDYYIKIFRCYSSCRLVAYSTKKKFIIYIFILLNETANLLTQNKFENRFTPILKRKIFVYINNLINYFFELLLYISNLFLWKGVGFLMQRGIEKAKSLLNNLVFVNKKNNISKRNIIYKSIINFEYIPYCLSIRQKIK